MVYIPDWTEQDGPHDRPRKRYCCVCGQRIQEGDICGDCAYERERGTKKGKSWLVGHPSVIVGYPRGRGQTTKER